MTSSKTACRTAKRLTIYQVFRIVCSPTRLLPPTMPVRLPTINATVPDARALMPTQILDTISSLAPSPRHHMVYVGGMTCARRVYSAGARGHVQRSSSSTLPCHVGKSRNVSMASLVMALSPKDTYAPCLEPTLAGAMALRYASCLRSVAVCCSRRAGLLSVVRWKKVGAC